MIKRNERVAVVGAGPGGLASSMLLSGEGYDVTVFEAREEIGGRNGKLTLGDFSFDIGPTFFLMPHLLEEMFAKVGKKLSNYLTLKRLDPMYRLHFPDDSSLDPSDSFEKMLLSLEQLSPNDALEFPRYYEYMDRKLAAILPILSKPYLKATDLASKDLFKAFPYLRPDRTLATELQSFFKDERTQLSFGFQAKYLGMSPYQCPSLFSILNFIEQKYGIWYPVGGLNQIPKALATAAEELGATIKLSSPVQHLNIKNRKIESLIVNDKEERFDHYIVNADLMAFLTQATGESDRKRYSDEKINNLKYSCSTFMMYLGVDTQVSLPHHSVVFSRDYKRFLNEISVSGKLSKDPSFYICNASASDPTLAPQGKSSVYILSPVPNLKIGSIDWKSAQSEYRDILLSKINERLGIDFKTHVETERVIDPLIWQDEFNVKNGAVFSLQHSLDQLLIFRPRNRFEEYENMYIVGGATHPGSGLPTIFQSAQIAVNLISKNEAVRV